jgi:hypothetical protein
MLCSGDRKAADGLGSIFEGRGGGGASFWLQANIEMQKIETINCLEK